MDCYNGFIFIYIYIATFTYPDILSLLVFDFPGLPTFTARIIAMKLNIPVSWILWVIYSQGLYYSSLTIYSRFTSTCFFFNHFFFLGSSIGVEIFDIQNKTHLPIVYTQVIDAPQGREVCLFQNFPRDPERGISKTDPPLDVPGR